MNGDNIKRYMYSVTFSHENWCTFKNMLKEDAYLAAFVSFKKEHDSLKVYENNKELDITNNENIKNIFNPENPNEYKFYDAEKHTTMLIDLISEETKKHSSYSGNIHYRLYIDINTIDNKNLLNVNTIHSPDVFRR